jgi:hypothetical protein
MTKRSELLLIVAWVVTFAIAGMWRLVTDAPFPFAGLRRLVMEAGPWELALQVGAVVLAGAWLALSTRATSGQLMTFVVICVALFIAGFAVIGVPFGLAFGCFGGMAYSRAARLAAAHQPLPSRPTHR